MTLVVLTIKWNFELDICCFYWYVPNSKWLSAGQRTIIKLHICYANSVRKGTFYKMTQHWNIELKLLLH